MQAKSVSSKSSSRRWFTPGLSPLRVHFWLILLDVLLFYSLVSLLTTGSQAWATRLAVVVLVVVFALSQWLVLPRRSQWLSRASRWVAFLLLNLALTAALVRLDSSYAFLFLVTAGYAFRYLPIRWAMLIGALTAAAVVAEHLGAFL